LLASAPESIKRALVEGTGEKDFAYGVGWVSVLGVLLQEVLVDLEGHEAEIVKIGQLLLQSGVRFEIDGGEVHAFWASGLVQDLLWLVVDWSFSTLVNVHLSVVVVLVELAVGDLFVLLLHLDGCLDSWLSWLLDKNAAPDLVAEADVVTGRHAEVAEVLAFCLWSGEANSPLVLLLRKNFPGESNWVGAKFVSVGLDQDDVLWPGGLAIVAHDPRLGEVNTWCNFKLVWEALLDKTARVPDHVLLGLAHSSLHLFSLSDLLVSDCLSILILADEFSWSLAWLTNFEHWVLRMNSFALANLTEVVVGANRAHEADALDWHHFTAIASEFLVDLLLLLSLALLEMLVEHASELN